MAVNSSVRPRLIKYIITVGILAALALIVGCSGDDDLLDQMGVPFRISGLVTYDDNGVTDGRSDMYQTACATGSEDELSLTVMIPYVSDETQGNDGYIYRVDVDWSPNGTTFMSSDYSFNMLHPIPANGGSLDLYLTVIDAADKADYRTDFPVATTNVYTIWVTTYITFTPLSPEEHYVIPAKAIGVTATEIDNCGS